MCIRDRAPRFAARSRICASCSMHIETVLSKSASSPTRGGRHYDVTGKNCPKYYVENPDAWIQMKSDIAAQIDVDAGEQEFYAERGFQNEPQRCKACRDARKNAARGPRQYFTAVCAACGGEAKVPFEPKSDRPVYCSECFAKMREQG